MGKEAFSLSRRDFLKTSAAISMVSATINPNAVFASGGNTLKVALIGCGGRGRGALRDFLQAAQHLGVKANIVGLADYFKESAVRAAAQFSVPQERCHTGAKAYKDVMASDADIVLLVTPPIFRPVHFEAAIKAGKHVFMEKPVAVDPPGARKIMESGKLASQKKLAVVAGTQRRHEKKYIETQYAVAKGAIGDIRSGKVWWCGEQGRPKERQPGEDDASYMIHNWFNFAEMSGDHIVEQHIHNIDIANWFIGKHPEIALGFGDRVRRKTGNQYDFFSVDFDYGDGLSIHSMCRQINGCYKRVGEFFTGTLGTTWGTGPGIKGFPKRVIVPEIKCVDNPFIQEHIDLIKGIIDGKSINEANNVAESTLTAIMGRISAYRGIPVRWKELVDETFGSPWYHLKMSPSPEDFENKTVKAPPENKIPVPGRD